MRWFEIFNVFLIYLLICVLAISYVEQYIYGNSPCPLCILQRFFILGIGVPLLFNITGPVNYKNIATSILSCVLGAIISLYQWSQLLINNGVTDFVKIFDIPLYVWSTLLFFGISIILFLMIFLMDTEVELNLHIYSKIAYISFIALVIIQSITTFSLCGLGYC